MTRETEERLDLAAKLGTRVPVIQSPMAGVQDGKLASAVTAAGGLGSVPAAMLSISKLEQALEQAVDQGPLNVNFFCHTPPVQDATRLQRLWELLTPYYEEFGLAVPEPQSGGRSPFAEDHAELIEHYRPTVVSFHFGLPAQPLLDRVRASGALVVSSATTVAEARFLEQQGVDIVIAQGVEAGGHRGMFLTTDPASQLGTFALLPQVVAAVDVPVVAAGGVADAQAVRAAFTLGASGVQAGTSFLCCDEADTSALHRAALRDADRETVLTNLLSGRPARGLRQRLINELGPLREDLPAFPLVATPLGPLRAAAEQQGDAGFSSLWSGQNRAGLIDGPASDVVAALADGL